ncbi:MAG: sigma-54 dependent transcriptional regulator [Acidobacteriota bacterium]
MTESSNRSPEPPVILTIDDDPDIVALIELRLRRWGYVSQAVGSAGGLWAFLDRATPDAMLMDVMLGDVDGSQLIEEVKQRFPRVPVIMITRSSSIDRAVRCMKHGAADYITKPIDFERLEAAIREALEVARVTRQASAMPTQRHEVFAGLIGPSQPMQALFQRIESVAPADVSVLILGETGTGKELVARAIHHHSRRREAPFIAVNAAAIPHDLIESQLFGHERGAFTGAGQAHVGYCEQADGGTFFLDEIGEMGFDVQVKLLRFLQDHVVQRVGSRTTRRVDVRVIAATNVDPLAQITKQKLREDLYYRLRVVSLTLPPLRQRGGDITLLAEHFLAQAARRHGRRSMALAPEAVAALTAYDWPGNVRQLANVIEEAVVVHGKAGAVDESGPVLTRARLPPEVVGRQPPNAEVASAPSAEGSVGFELPLTLRQASEKQALVEALERHGGQVEDAARALGISRATIYRRLKKYGLPSLRAAR